MTPQERRQMIRRLFEESSRGNLDVVDEAYAKNCSIHDPAFPVKGITEIKEEGRHMRAAIPDLQSNVHEILVDGDMTSARWTMGGTHRGEFHGLPPTGKTFVLTGVVLDKWEGDRIVEEWNYYDVASMLQQLGLIPEMSQLTEMATRRGSR